MLTSLPRSKLSLLLVYLLCSQYGEFLQFWTNWLEFNFIIATSKFELGGSFSTGNKIRVRFFVNFAPGSLNEGSFCTRNEIRVYLVPDLVYVSPGSLNEGSLCTRVEVRVCLFANLFNVWPGNLNEGSFCTTRNEIRVYCFVNFSLMGFVIVIIDFDFCFILFWGGNESSSTAPYAIGRW